MKYHLSQQKMKKEKEERIGDEVKKCMWKKTNDCNGR